MTLLELTVVIMVLLTLITVLFFGAQAWKRGSDRALCIIQIRNVQSGLRSYANLYGHSPGAAVVDLKGQVIGLGRYIETAPECPGYGIYAYGQISGTDTIPPIGELYLSCSQRTTDQHEPTEYSNW